MRKFIALGLWLVASLATLVHPATAAELRVMISGGYAATFLEIAPIFEKESGNTVTVIRGPSMGETPEAIPNRLRRGEAADLLIMVGSALDGLINGGLASAPDRVDLARSGIGLAVRQGAPHPDIGSEESLKRALLTARSIAYSDSASGVYLSTKLFPRLGIAEQLKDKARMIPAEPVGAVVARGEAELGFQQISELKPITGIDIVGPLPAGAQLMTVFSASLANAAHEPEAARALLRFLSTSAVARKAVVASGMEPVSTSGEK